MSRSVKEWIGKNDDSKPPARVRVRVFSACDGVCGRCHRRIVAGETWECDHTIALINGGLNRESNLGVLCKWCHAHKTVADLRTKSKTYAVRQRHLGLKKAKGRPMPGTKASGWKQKMDGTWEKR